MLPLVNLNQGPPPRASLVAFVRYASTFFVPVSKYYGSGLQAIPLVPTLQLLLLNCNPVQNKTIPLHDAAENALSRMSDMVAPANGVRPSQRSLWCTHTWAHPPTSTVTVTYQDCYMDDASGEPSSCLDPIDMPRKAAYCRKQHFWIAGSIASSWHRRRHSPGRTLRPAFPLPAIRNT